MNLHRVQQKEEKWLSQEYEKDRTVQHKKMKAALPKIASTAMMDICEAECPDDISPIEMEEGVNDIKDYKNKKNCWGKRGRIPRWHFPFLDGGRCKY